MDRTLASYKRLHKRVLDAHLLSDAPAARTGPRAASISISAIQPPGYRLAVVVAVWRIPSLMASTRLAIG
jgi:hypothetical protein